MEPQLKVLKVMSGITGHLDMNQFAQAVGLTPQQTTEQMKELAKAGLVKKVDSGYSITEKGKATLKAVEPVAECKEFRFYIGIGENTGFSVGSVREFHDVAEKVDARSLEFHLNRGDFENWISTAVNDAALAQDFTAMKTKGLKGETLRKAITKAIETRFSLCTC